MEETENNTPFVSPENSDSPSSSSPSPPPLPPAPLNAPPLVTDMMAISMRLQQQQQQQHMEKSNLSVITSTGSLNFDLLRNKSKRGRPRKYDSDGNLSISYKKSIQSQQSAVTLLKSPPGFVLSPNVADFDGQKGGGFGNRNCHASLGDIFANTAGGDFIPHVLTVHKGEDVASKILSFPQKGPRGLCILSANGAVSNVTIRQPGSSGGILTYEGRFEILSLTGSFTIVDNGGVKDRTGGLSVSLAGPDGRVIGGAIAGFLTASSPIQVVIGIFMLNGYFNTHKRKLNRDFPTASSIPSASDTTTTSEKPLLTRVTPDSETTQTPTCVSQQGRPNIHEEPDYNDNKHIMNFSLPNNTACNGSSFKSARRPSPDINLSGSMPPAPVEQRTSS